MSESIPTECQCTAAGFCALLNRQMHPVRFDECKNKPHYFEMFLSERKKYAGKNISKPKLVQNKVNPHVQRYIDGRKNKIDWAVGITTVPSRFETHFMQSLASITGAGFNNIHLFVDGADGYERYTALKFPTTIHSEPLLPYGNWITALWELYARNPLSNRFAIFQDDITCVQNLREYLDQIEYPQNGYWNLYTFPFTDCEKVQQRPPKDHQGFYLSNQDGLSALGLVFDNPTVMKLLSSPHIVGKPRAPLNGHKSIDGGVSTALKKAGIKEWVHFPSLMQHTGTLQSTAGNRVWGQTTNYIEGFNPLSLLPEPSPETLFGDVVANALKYIGITPDRVSAFLGKECGCAERQEKLNQLHAHAKQVIKKKTDKAIGMFKNLLGLES